MAVAEKQPAGPGGALSTGVRQTLSGQWLRFVVQVVSVVALARLVPPDEFGVYALVAAVVAVGVVLTDSGLSYAAVQAPGLSPAQQSNLFWISTGAGVLLTGLTCLLAPLVAAFYDQPRLVAVLLAVSPVFLMSALTAQLRVDLTRRLRFAQLATADVVGQTSGLLVALAVAAVHPSVWALVAQQVTAVAVSLVCTASASRWRPGRPSRSGDVRPLLRYAAAVAGDQVLGHLSARADTVVLGRWSDVADVGLYARMHQLFSIPLQQVAAPLTRVVLPHLSRLDGPGYLAVLVRVQRALTYACVLPYALVVVAAEPLVTLALGPAWTAGAPVLAVLAVGGMFQASGYVCYWVYLSRARMGLALRIGVLSRVLLVVLVVLAGPRGTLAVACAVTGAAALTWGLQYLVGMPRAGVRSRALLRPVLRPALLGACVVVVGLGAGRLVPSGGPLLDLGLALLVSALVVAAACALVRGVRADLAGVLATVRRRGEV